MNVIEKIAAKAVNRVSLLAGWTQMRFAERAELAHVLCYHTIIPDESARAGWSAPHAVTVSAFEQQMAMLAELRCVRRLDFVADQIVNGLFNDGPAVSITFDDGLADNVMLALPILQRHNLAATFFLATGIIDRGDLFPSDKIRILRDAYQRGRLKMTLHPICERLLTQPGYYKATSLSEYREHLDELWASARLRVDPAAVEACRVMRWDEARLLRDAGMEIGAHTVNHVILSRETVEVRQFEIVESIRRVRAEMRRDRVPFAYPNGQPTDFSESDVSILKEIKAPYAVTTEAGPNNAESSPLTLRRHCIGLYHDVSSLWTALAD